MQVVENEISLSAACYSRPVQRRFGSRVLRLFELTPCATHASTSEALEAVCMFSTYDRAPSVSPFLTVGVAYTNPYGL